MVIRFLRKKFRNNIVYGLFTYLFFFLVILFASIGLAFIMHEVFEVIYIPEANQIAKANFEKWDKSITVAISISGFISLILTLSIWRSNDQRQIGLSAINLFDKFRDERISKIRDSVWAVRIKWFNQENYKTELLSFSYSKMNERMFSEELNKTLKEDLRNLYDLFEVFNILSLHTENSEIIKRCRYFYYLWWRKFLYEVAIELDNNESNFISDEFKEYETVYEEYLDNISYVKTLNRLDKALGFSKIPYDLEIHKYD